jgi:hypothetical protein
LPVVGVTDGVSRISASARLAIGVGMLLWGASQTAVVSTLAVCVLGAVLAVPALVELLPRGTFAIRPGLPAGTILRFFLAFGFFGGEALILARADDAAPGATDRCRLRTERGRSCMGWSIVVAGAR